MSKRVSGTREWAKYSENFVKGCSNGCLYCYSRYNAIERKEKTAENWTTEEINWEEIYKTKYKKDGVIMVPTLHDISPNTLDAGISFLKRLLRVGNELLIVSKPHLVCIQKLCTELEPYKSQILFRFTIGACDSKILKFWETNAPSFEERLEALKCAFNVGYFTSISVEPMLDSANVLTLFNTLEPFVTDSIWIGKMNQIDYRVIVSSPEMTAEVERIKIGQTDEKIWAIYNALKENPKVRWKDSVKQVVGIDSAPEAGLDV